MSNLLLADEALARRLERTEAHANRAFVQARARITPEVGATWCDVHGTWAMFDGVGSPLTQTFGFGLFAPPDDAQLDALEAFFASRGADICHEVSPIADAALLPLLAARGYQVIEWSSVLVQPVPARDEPAHAAAASALHVRRIDLSEADAWADVAAEGWIESGFADFVRAFGQVNARAEDTHCFLAERDGVPVASGALHLHGGVALFAGASTIPSARRMGAQRALLDARLRFAADAGCDLAMMVAAPGSASQRNAQRAGFVMAYTRVKWMRAAAASAAEAYAAAASAG
jgi:GNAT superfamily N-acetyltransferase